MAKINVIRREEPETPRSNPYMKTSPRDLAKQLRAKHTKQGIPEPKVPDVYPELPSDITELGSKDLSELYGRLAAFGEYVGYHLAIAEVRLLGTQQDYVDEQSKEMLVKLESAGDKKVSVAQLKAQVRANGKLQELNEQVVYHQAEVILLKERLSALERSIRVLSREQSRREAESEHKPR